MIIFILSLAISSLAYAEIRTPSVEPAEPEKINCQFSKFKSLGEIAEFYPAPKEALNLKSDDDKKFEKRKGGKDLNVFYRIGQIKAGPCKEADIYVGLADGGGACGKNGGDPLYLYSISGVPYLDNTIAPEESGFGPCIVPTRFYKMGERLITTLPWDRAEYFPIFKSKFPKAVLQDAEDGQYENIFWGGKKFEYNGRSLEVNFEGYFAPLRQSDLKLSEFQRIFSEKDYGEIHVRRRQAYIFSEDAFAWPIDLNLEEKIDNYGYVGILGQNPTPFKDSDLDVKGKNAKREISLKDLKHPYLKTAYEAFEKEEAKAIAKINKSPEMYQGKIKPLSFEDFVNKKPFLFKEDKLGRLQVFARLYHEVPYMAEPLIYVYSTKSQKMNIHFAENVDVMVSYPNFGGGWNFETAPPDKVKIGSGKIYDSLFWEGVAGHIPPYKYGWTVRSHDIANFLNSKLKELGLNEKETAEFKKYWVPRLQSSEYYRLEFLPQNWMDDLCALKISPAPDTVIRVHMRAYPLKHFVKSSPSPAAEIPKRSGVTVVEWGGFISDL